MRVEPPWTVFVHDGFAGPRTRLRGTRLDVDDPPTFEAIARTSVPDDRVPAGAVRVFDEQRSELLLVPSLAGATLGEIIDESERQSAKLDLGFTIAIVEPVLGEMGQRRSVPAAVSIDHIVVGFEGGVLFRGHLPWWGERRPHEFLAMVPGMSRMLTPDLDAETMMLAADVLNCAMTSKRASFANPTETLGSVASAFLTTALGGAALPDFAGLWNARNAAAALNPLSLLNLLSNLDKHPRATPAALGALVQNLFPERFAEEKRTLERIEGMR